MPTRKKITKTTRRSAYSTRHYLSSSAQEELGLLIPFPVYIQDPTFSLGEGDENIDENFLVPWEPGLSDGPTSARFAVVDYNSDTQHIEPMARWNESQDLFLNADNTPVVKESVKSPQFHQVSVWALLQRALAFFEEGDGLGRRIPYAFEGNRLIVVPHAGYGENAFYDRESKSLQFYYFDRDEGRIFTCLSADIVNHEFAHALLDGIRPYFLESVQVQSAAFHEFAGDMTAILLSLRSNTLRKHLAKDSGGDLSSTALSNIAEQFGKAVTGRPYLRTALSERTLEELESEREPHLMSEVLTAAMFDILLKVSKQHIGEGTSAAQAFWYSIQRMQRMVIQPLDLLPPVDVEFRDYALAVIRAEELSNPTDPRLYQKMMLDAFIKRKILTETDRLAIKDRTYLYDRIKLAVPHGVEQFSRSKDAAYRFLDDNREAFFIPPNQDFVVADLYKARKLGRARRKLPPQVVLVYLWREEILLKGEQFSSFNGKRTSLLCGGTLVFDEQGNLQSWMRKPGTYCKGKRWKEESQAGKVRFEAFCKSLADLVSRGQVGGVLGSHAGLLKSHIAPALAMEKNGIVQFRLAPHLGVAGEDCHKYEGGHQWQVSS